jgi:hypothetical protein
MGQYILPLAPVNKLGAGDQSEYSEPEITNRTVTGRRVGHSAPERMPEWRTSTYQCRYFSIMENT